MSFNFWLPNSRHKGMNKAAYRGDLNCPACQSTANRFVENVGPYMSRYCCRKCGMRYMYDTNRNQNKNPYGGFNKTKWQDLARIQDNIAKGRQK